MAPKSTVPMMPTIPKAGEAGAVVPTPADCQPEKKWCQLVDHDGSGASCPTSGRVPKNSSRVPTAITTNADDHGDTRWRPVLSGAGGSGGRSGRAPRGAQVVELVEVGVLAEGRGHAAGEHGDVGVRSSRDRRPSRRPRRWRPRAPDGRAG